MGCRTSTGVLPWISSRVMMLLPLYHENTLLVKVSPIG
jgi:hypothetical protein